MELNEYMRAEKESETEHLVVYRYGHLIHGDELTGVLSITKTDFPSVSTISLEEGYETRINEMRMGGQIILDHLNTGEWPDESYIR